MKALIHIAVLGLIAGVAVPAGAETMTFTVDCSKGDTIGAALARGDARKPMVLNVSGTCHEAVSIKRDDVTLQGNPRATIAPPDNKLRAIDVSGSDINLVDLDIVGGSLGISFNGTARANATNCTVRDTTGDGVRLFSGDARLAGLRIENAGGHGLALTRRSSAGVTGATDISGSQLDGIYATLNSVLSMTGGYIHENGHHGVEAEHGAEASLSGTSVEGNAQAGVAVLMAHAFVVNGNTIRGNQEQGIVVLAGANAAIDYNTIAENGGDGVTGYLGATVVMHGNEVSRNVQAGVSCNSHCTLQIGDEANIHDNTDAGIVLMRGSILIVEEPAPGKSKVTSEDNGSWGLWCGDAQSSVGGLENLTGSVSEGCVEFGN